MAGSTEKRTKMGMVRVAYKKGHTKAKDIVAFLASEWGEEISEGMAANYATKAKKEAAMTPEEKQAKKDTWQATLLAEREAEAGPGAAPIQQTAQAGAGGDSFTGDSLLAVKELLHRHGAASVRRMIDILG